MSAPRGGDSEARGLHVVTVIKTQPSGLWLIPQMRVLLERGDEVTVILPAGPGHVRTALEELGAELLRLRVVDSAFDFSFRPGLRMLRGLRRFRRQLAALEPDVLFYQMIASALAVRLASRGWDVPRVHMVPGPLYLDSAVLRLVERALCRMDTVLIAASEYTRARYRALGMPDERMRTVPYGVDAEYFAPASPAERAAAREALDVPADLFVAVMVAYVYAPKGLVHRGHGIKGHDVLIEAWADFHRDHPQSLLVCVGSAWYSEDEAYRAQLMARGRELAGDGIRWVDSQSDVRPWYRLADLSVSPSLSENHGAAREAGMIGMPQIVSDAGALPETVTPESGWVTPAGEPGPLRAALDEAWKRWQAGELEAMGRRSREHILGMMEERRAVGDMADVIHEAAAGRVAPPTGGSADASVLVVTEARFGQDAEGAWAAEDASIGEPSWAPYHRAFPHVATVGRARAVPGTAAIPIGEVETVALPYLVGPRRLATGFPALVRALGQALREPGLVVVRVPGAVSVAASLVLAARRRPHAVEVFGDSGDVVRAGALGRSGRRLSGLAAGVTRWQVRQARAGVLYQTSGALQERYPAPAGVPTAAVSVVDLGDEDFVAGPRSAPPGPPVVVAVGSQEQPYKGHDVLVRALARLRRQGRDVRATIVGRGRHHQALRTQIAELGLDDAVTLVERIDVRAEMHQLFDEAALLAMPSLSEGLPRVLVEAMARGLPAVGSAVGGIPELLDDEVLVPPGDDEALATAIAAVLDDPERWRHQSARNLDHARSFHRDLLHAAHAQWLETSRAHAGGRS